MVNDIPILNEWLLVSMPIPMEPQRQAIGNLNELKSHCAWCCCYLVHIVSLEFEKFSGAGFNIAPPFRCLISPFSHDQIFRMRVNNISRWVLLLVGHDFTQGDHELRAGMRNNLHFRQCVSLLQDCVLFLSVGYYKQRIALI